MNTSNELERDIRAMLADIAPAREPARLFDAVMAGSTNVRQRPALLAGRLPAGAWLTGPTSERAEGGRPPLLRPLLIVALLALALAAAIVLVSGTRQGPRPLLGELSPTGSLHAGMFEPSTLVLRDGTTLLAGATTDLKLHLETWDPSTGAFTVVPGVGDRRFAHGRDALGLTELPDGSVLLVMRHASSQSGAESGGYALRYDRVTGAIDETGSFNPASAPADDLLGFPFSAWPSSVRPDGKVAWTPAPWQSTTTVTYDPVADLFAVEDSGGPDSARLPTTVVVDGSETTLSDGAIAHLDDGRYLLVGGSSDPPFSAALVDGTTFDERALDWPLVFGGQYNATKVRGGRVLITGPTTATYDPRTDLFVEVERPGTLTPALTLHDGRVLLQEAMPLAVGETTERVRLVVFDPATGAFTPIGPDPLPDPPSSWTELPDGRVLMIREDVESSPEAGRAWILR